MLRSRCLFKDSFPALMAAAVAKLPSLQRRRLMIPSLWRKWKPCCRKPGAWPVDLLRITWLNRWVFLGHCCRFWSWLLNWDRWCVWTRYLYPSWNVLVYCLQLYLSGMWKGMDIPQCTEFTIHNCSKQIKAEVVWAWAVWELWLLEDCLNVLPADQAGGMAASISFKLHWHWVDLILEDWRGAVCFKCDFRRLSQKRSRTEGTEFAKSIKEHSAVPDGPIVSPLQSLWKLPVWCFHVRTSRCSSHQKECSGSKRASMWQKNATTRMFRRTSTCRPQRNHGNITHYRTIPYGGFHKWGYPQIIRLNGIFHYKPSIVGYPHWWNPPYHSQPLRTWMMRNPALLRPRASSLRRCLVTRSWDELGPSVFVVCCYPLVLVNHQFAVENGHLQLIYPSNPNKNGNCP